MTNKNNVRELISPLLIPQEDRTDVRWNRYIELKKQAYHNLSGKELTAHLVSEANWMIRNRAKSCEQFSVKIRIGDVCYIDFGPAYLNEAGFQHFGLVIAIVNSKAFVVPMTSNSLTYAQAYDPVEYPCGKKHLMRLGLIEGLKKESVLFLNDCKYINTARIIDVKAHINPNDNLFKSIKERVVASLVD